MRLHRRSKLMPRKTKETNDIEKESKKTSSEV
jgi:hypothetical protein